jgi:hypothetical protein
MRLLRMTLLGMLTAGLARRPFLAQDDRVNRALFIRSEAL